MDLGSICSDSRFFLGSKKGDRFRSRATNLVGQTESELTERPTKVAAFIVIQALVFLVLYQSTTIFSSKMRTDNRTSRSRRLQQMLYILSDYPLAAEDER